MRLFVRIQHINVVDDGFRLLGLAQLLSDQAVLLALLAHRRIVVRYEEHGEEGDYEGEDEADGGELSEGVIAPNTVEPIWKIGGKQETRHLLGGWRKGRLLTGCLGLQELLDSIYSFGQN